MLERLERLFKSSYLKMLEGENQRLRDEQRQLMNALLQANGIHPVEQQKPAGPPPGVTPKSWNTIQRNIEKKSSERAFARSAAMHTHAPTEAGQA